MTTYRNLGDRPLYTQLSTVSGLRIIPFGFNVGADGALNAADNANPPQIYAEAGADEQEYILNCPKGNPDKVWAICWAEDGLTASVSDYSTIVDGTLAIDLSAVPAGDMKIQGLLCYGTNSADVKGSVSAAPGVVSDMRSIQRHAVDGMLKRTVVIPVGWTSDGSGDVTSTRGPLGTSVSRTGVGEYTITFDHAAPFGFEEHWAKVQGASDGRNAEFTYTASGTRKAVVMTFSDGANMGNGERASVFFIGPNTYYPLNYGGASGGVHADLQARDVKNYTSYPADSPLRECVLVPFHAVIAAAAAGPTEATSNLPHGMRITRTAAGVYSIYCGKLPSGGLVADAFTLANGVKIGITAVDEAAGTLTLTAVGAADPGATTLSGLMAFRVNNMR